MNFPEMYAAYPAPWRHRAMAWDLSKLGPCDCSRTPLLCGYRPVMRAHREGQQDDSVTKFCVLRVALAIHAAVFGMNPDGIDVAGNPWDRIPEVIEVVDEHIWV